MYETELVRKVARDTRLSQRIVRDVLGSSLEAITQALRQGQEVVLQGAGTFSTKERKPSQVRNIRNPSEVLTIAAMRRADFRTGELLRRAVCKSKRGRPAQTTE